MKPTPTRGRRAIIAAFALSAVFATSACTGQEHNGTSSAAKETRTITDALGNEVQIPKNIERIQIDGQRLIYTTALLNKENPIDKVIAWPTDMEENDHAGYEKYAAKFPAIKDIPTTGEVYNNTLSLEQVLESRPDVFVMSAGTFDAARDAGLIDGLKKAGIPTVTIDYFVDPVAHTLPSIRVMGELLGKQKEAEEFAKYYQSKIDRVTSRVKNAEKTPTFLWRAPGYFDCCSTFAKSNLAQLIDLAGGKNIGDEMIDAKQGQVSAEALVDKDPKVIISTGADWDSGKTPVKPGNYVPLGYGEEPAKAATDLKTVVQRQAGVREMDAVKNKRVYAAWHHFYDSPYNYLAVEMFAKAMHPELFEDIDPAKEVQELHQKFLPVEASGTFWTGLE